MVEFAGYALPVQYSGVLPVPPSLLFSRRRSISPSVAPTPAVSSMCLIWDRSSARCSHVIMRRWTGKDRVEFLERILVSDVHSLQPTQGRLTLICQEDGGIIDDTVITNAGDYQ